MTDERIGGNTYENTYETHAHMREQNRRFGDCSDTHSWVLCASKGAGAMAADVRELGWGVGGQGYRYGSG